MNADELHDDPLLRCLGALPAEDVDPARAARARGRCHAALRRQARPGRPQALRLAGFCRRFVEPVLVSALCAVCLIEVARRAAALLGP
jgi:hypothetical protein